MDPRDMFEEMWSLAEKILDRAVPGNLASMTTVVTTLRALGAAIRMGRSGRVKPEEAIAHGRKLLDILKANDASADGKLAEKFKGKK